MSCKLECNLIFEGRREHLVKEIGRKVIYLTIVRRNHGLFTTDGTASSMRECVLMKFSVSSGNSLEDVYFSSELEPAQEPGLNQKQVGRKYDYVAS